MAVEPGSIPNTRMYTEGGLGGGEQVSSIGERIEFVQSDDLIGALDLNLIVEFGLRAVRFATHQNALFSGAELS